MTRRDSARVRLFGALTASVICVCLWLLAAEAYGGDGVQQPRVAIPAHSLQYRIALHRETSRRWGLDAPTARVAAQIHQESRWQADARSPFAEGLAQFVPRTAAWIPEICPEVGEPDPWDPYWSIRAAVCFDHWLWQRAEAATPCDRWAFVLSDYNGGRSWRVREQALAAAAELDRQRWFDHVETQRARSLDAWRENRGYVRRILTVLEPAYVAAGWPGGSVCV